MLSVKRVFVLAALGALACGVEPSPRGHPTAVGGAPIYNGQVDLQEYPQVGTFVWRNPIPGAEWRSRCTGTLIAPSVFLTAAHCILNTFGAGAGYGDYGVSFDSIFDPGSSEVILGTALAHPDFSFDTAFPDVGVVVLDRAITHAKPSKILAGLDRLEKIDPAELAEADIVLVGYGSAVDDPARTGRGTRRSAVQRFQGFLDSVYGVWSAPYLNWVQLGGPFEEGYGTTCIGDSGGPHFLDGRIIAVTSHSGCNLFDDGVTMEFEYAQRVDVATVRKFILPFLEERDP
jgi:hypothetical protein